MLLRRKLPCSFTKIMSRPYKGYEYIKHIQSTNYKSKLNRVFKYSKTGDMELVRADVTHAI
jgi:hypothetical protein